MWNAPSTDGEGPEGRFGSEREPAIPSRSRRVPALLSISVGSLVLVLATLEAFHLVATSAYDQRFLPVCRVDTDRDVVALTFDDGPDNTLTPEILRLLLRHDARGTFFVIGRRARARTELVATQLAAEMEVGNHTWSHIHLDQVSLAQAVSQVDRAQSVLVDVGVRSRLFRAPFGVISPEQLNAIARSGFVTIHWSLAIDHYVGGLGMSSGQAAESFFNHVQSGDIILAHDAYIGSHREGGGRRRAIEALSLVLRKLRSAGYVVVPVGQLLSEGSAIRAAPRQWFWQSGFTCPRD